MGSDRAAAAWQGGWSGPDGLGWFVFENRNLLDIPAVFARLFTAIIVGLAVENFILRVIERRTIMWRGSWN